VNRILVIEDEQVIRNALCRLLERNGYHAGEAGSIDEARPLLQGQEFDLVIADLRLPGAPGTDVIPLAEGIPVLVMTSYASVRSAVESMKLGAVDYIAKPFDHDEMLLLVERTLARSRLERQKEALKSDLERSYPVTGMVGDCPTMREAFERIRRVAPTDTTVLILGESGTGKELAARAVHENSLRRDAPIITVNCAAIPEGLIESELFGHAKGAFTGAVEARQGLIEMADGGTLFLDEIGELSPPTQARLLRVLQQGEIRRVGADHDRQVDIRLVAATHRDLRQLVDAQQFREDLYFRLRVMEILLPPVRERGPDIDALADFLLVKTCKRLNRQTLSFAGDAREAIRGYPWPGNVREMENAIERAVILSDDGPLCASALALGPTRPPPTGTAQPPMPEARGDQSLEAYFRSFVLAHQDELTETELAKRLGISRKALWERRQRFDLPRPKR
jgi:DNA-binding NtrC family response regulator